jgi:hypothetical protein
MEKVVDFITRKTKKKELRASRPWFKILFITITLHTVITLLHIIKVSAYLG